MKAVVPVIVKDPVVTDYKDVAPTEQITIEEATFLDGPISPRVAVLDFDPETGLLAPPISLLQPTGRSRAVTYELTAPVIPGDPNVSPPATAVSVFGAVHKTIAMFEEPDALGRRVDWAFAAPQLLVVPRAGDMANAYYERESHSLQFFSFVAPGSPVPIHTANSQDIVAHETAHALLDGIAPDLYSTISPQGLAIHEGVADLASLLVSLRCRELTRRVLSMTGGDISRSSVFSGLAEQFGSGLDPDRYYLRNLNNDVGVGDVPDNEPHELSTVLSGAFYRLLVQWYGELCNQYQSDSGHDAGIVPHAEAKYVEQSAQADTGPSASLEATAKALFVAAERVKRTLLRGLDYLPPGDVTFADLARAVLASDAASHPDSDTSRHWLADEFVRRQIVTGHDQLEVPINYEEPALQGVDIDELTSSDFAAYGFANAHRDLLSIPPEVPFEIRDRLDVTKLYWHRDGKRQLREVLFKVSWSEIEPNQAGGGTGAERRVVAGTTLAIGLDRRRPYVRAVVTTRRGEADRAASDSMLSKMLLDELITIGDPAQRAALTGRGSIVADIRSGVLRLSGTARSLHITSPARGMGAV